ncbi:DivIVA domain-containing protein [Mesoplasma lactucae]|nr:DivIVA domain-containing protein [Mesoplasma lactucae]ATZ20256.1 hypothetical protein MLACT_v1c04350 [Mesoplasma lactucae ATCC 49193]MCL8216427.1 Cell cycle protein GpsB [Mesoplasma lactucae ATCC 49193]
MVKILNFDEDAIRTKDFQIVDRGYNPKEVDAFLDQVSEDYEWYDNEVSLLKTSLEEQYKENQSLRDQLVELKKQLTDKVQTEGKQTKETFSNPDMVKRMANMEKDIYDLKQDIGLIASSLSTLVNNNKQN